MQYFGEILSLFVAFSWTVAALSCEIGSRRMGVVVLNVWRMVLSLLFSCLISAWLMGDFLPVHASLESWLWLLASGVVGYFFGDWCLFNAYLSIGSRYGQLFMTLAPMFAAFSAWGLLGQTLTGSSLIAMLVTLSGIAVSVFGRDGKNHGFSLCLPVRGVLFGIGAALGQGLGLVLSKIGLDAYTADLVASGFSGEPDYVSFSANAIRCMAGLVGFTTWLAVRRGMPGLRKSLHDRAGLLVLLVAVFSGPVIGVACSLMAVQYVEAGVASTLMALSPVLILLPSYWIFKQRITLQSIVGAAVSVVGVSLFFLL